MPQPDTPLWLFADQLGPHVHGGEHAHRPVLLIEATSALRRRRFHRQKLHLVLSALRYRPHPTHFSIDEAVAVAARIGAARTLFTHIAHEVDHGALLRELPAGVELGYDGLVVELA